MGLGLVLPKPQRILVAKQHRGLALPQAPACAPHFSQPIACPALPRSIEAWREGLPNMLSPAPLDASAPDTWPVEPASCCAVVCANMAHISPLACTTGLVAGAGRALAPGGLLFIYGPFLVDGKPTTVRR